MEPVNTYKSWGKSLQKMLFYLDMLVIFPPSLDWLWIVMALRISSLEKTEMTHGWQLAMHHMVKCQLNHFKIKLEWCLEIKCHWMTKILLRVPLLAKKTMHFNCVFSHWSQPERHLPHSVVDSFKAKPGKYFNGI